MIVHCPNPRCAHKFDVEDTCAGKNGPCPACGQIITFRPASTVQQITAERERLRSVSRTQTNVKETPVSPFSALLVDIRSLWNVGAIFRTADGAGVKRLYLTGITGTPPRKEIAKTALGAEQAVEWRYRPDATELCRELKAAGVQTIAIEKSSQSLPIEAVQTFKPQGPICLIVGNEVGGLPEELLAECSASFHLSMRGIKSSLNVAVAFGIASYAFAAALERKTPETLEA